MRHILLAVAMSIADLLAWGIAIVHILNHKWQVTSL